jgi:hypothetical protein
MISLIQHIQHPFNHNHHIQVRQQAILFMINCCMILGIIHRNLTLGGHQNLLIETIILLGL